MLKSKVVLWMTRKTIQVSKDTHDRITELREKLADKYGIGITYGETVDLATKSVLKIMKKD